jgi:IPTL-CTERM motif
MMTRSIILPFLLLTVLILTLDTQANVLVDDADSNAVSEENVAFTSEIVPTGSGQEGDYELIACAVSVDQGNTFSDPSPGTWAELDAGPCGNGVCIHGIWGRFTDNPASENITCSWDFPSFVFAAGSFRYNEVDPIDPIIAVECNSGGEFGANVMATAPSIETIAGSQVARIFTYRNFDSFVTDDFNSNNDTMGSFTSLAAVTSVNVNMQGTTELVLVDGPTGEASIGTGLDGEWIACTIALRMAPVVPVRNVPTLSEWGFIAFAAFMGIAGIWFLRRRQAEAT